MDDAILSYEDLLVSKYIDTIGHKAKNGGEENKKNRGKDRPGSASSSSTLSSPYKASSGGGRENHHQQKSIASFPSSSPYLTRVRRSHSSAALDEEMPPLTPPSRDGDQGTALSQTTPPPPPPPQHHHVRFEREASHRGSRSYDDERVPGHPYRQRLTPARLRRHHSVSALSSPNQRQLQPQPQYRRPRPSSGRSHNSSVSSRASSSSAFSARSYAHMRQPRVLRVVAFKNGSVDDPIRLAVSPPSLKLLLEEATHKLRLSSAARKLFLKDGTPVGAEEAQELLMGGGGEGGGDVQVFVSRGEPFKDPMWEFTGKDKDHLKDVVVGGGGGGSRLPEGKGGGGRGTKEAKMTKRMKALVGGKSTRVLVFLNGVGRENDGIEVVSNLNSLEAFCEACTARLGLASKVRWSESDDDDEE